MPFPVLPALSSEDDKVGSSAATPGRYSGHRAVPFREVVPPFRAEATVTVLHAPGPSADELCYHNGARLFAKGQYRDALAELARVLHKGKCKTNPVSRKREGGIR